MWSLPFLAVALALFFWMISGRFVETDNAYVKGDRAYIATEISGPIVEVSVRENQRVSRGHSKTSCRCSDFPHALNVLDNKSVAFAYSLGSGQKTG